MQQEARVQSNGKGPLPRGRGSVSALREIKPLLSRDREERLTIASTTQCTSAASAPAPADQAEVVHRPASGAIARDASESRPQSVRLRSQ